jgi:hypothetical protein
MLSPKGSKRDQRDIKDKDNEKHDTTTPTTE